jgi:hypothetical protein
MMPEDAAGVPRRHPDLARVCGSWESITLSLVVGYPSKVQIEAT